MRRRSLFHLAFVVSLGVGLTGCAAPSNAPATAPSGTKAGGTKAGGTKADGSATGVETGVETNASVETRAPAATPAPAPQATPTVVPKPAKPLPALSTLMGRAPAGLSALLGPPTLRRVDPPAELWQYRGADCVLALYLYPDGKAGPRTVTHIEARDRDAHPTAPEPCFHELLRPKG